MPNYRKPNRSDWQKSLLFVGIYVATISIAAFILLVTYWYFWIALVASGLFILVLWHKKSTIYRCPKCGNEFEVSFLTDLFSPHGASKEGGWMYLKCPRCQNRSKMQTRVKQNPKNAKYPAHRKVFPSVLWVVSILDSWKKYRIKTIKIY